MQPHQERVVTEQKELDEKREKLTAFVGSETFRTLDDAERNRLRHQLDLMNQYSQVLGARIAAFPKE